MNKNYVTTLNGLRFYLFLLILATHYKYIIAASPVGYVLYPYLNQQDYFAVLFFFILSGFCIALGYSDKFNYIDKISYFSFVKKRTLRIYPLYFITGLLMLLSYYLPRNFDWLYAFIFLYIPMLAPYTPFQDGGGNGAGWFISSLFLCYLVTPLMIHIFKKQRLFLYLLITYISIIFTAIIPLISQTPQHYFDFLYKFPLERIFQYSFGLILGMYYVNKSYKLQTFFCLHKHPILCESFIILFALMVMSIPKYHAILNPIIGTPVISLIIVYLCYVKKGFLYNLLTHKLSQYIGNISFECYLMHYLLCILLSKKLEPLCFSFINIVIYYCVLLFITIFISIFYRNVKLKLKK